MKFICEVTVKDPDSNGDVEVEIWKDPSGFIFGIDSSYLDQVTSTIFNPMNGGAVSLCLKNGEMQATMP